MKFRKSEAFELAPDGTQPAVLSVIANLGRVASEFNGESKIRPIIGLVWVLAEPGSDGGELSIQETLTLSFHEKSKLYSRLCALNGGKPPSDGQEIESFLGKAVLLTIAHTQKGERTYANVATATPPLRGMATPAMAGEPVFYDIDNPGEGAYLLLPPRFRRIIDEQAQAPQATNAALPYDDAIPF
jgi:hypothetical protein